MNDLKHRSFTAHRRPRVIKLNKARLKLVAFAIACVLGGTFALGVAWARVGGCV